MRTRLFLGQAAALATALLLLSATATLFAQTPTAVVNGAVVDPSGAIVPDAKVTVVNQDTNISSTKTTGADGTFTIINLLPGTYTLTVEKTGFKRIALPAFKLDVNQTLTENLALQVGESTQTVTVSAESVGVMVQRSTTELGTTFDEKMAHELPLNGRNFTQLLILQPGVNPVDTSQGNSSGKTGAGGNPDGGNISIPSSTVYKVSVNGAGNRSNAYYMDGIINTDDRGGGWAVPPIADTIQEFKVQSHNNDAQYGNVLGSVVNMVTKSGTNQFHGDGVGIRAQPDFRCPQSVHGLLLPGILSGAGQYAGEPGGCRNANRGGCVRHPNRYARFAARLLAERIRRHIRRADHQE